MHSMAAVVLVKMVATRPCKHWGGPPDIRLAAAWINRPAPGKTIDLRIAQELTGGRPPYRKPVFNPVGPAGFAWERRGSVVALYVMLERVAFPGATLFPKTKADLQANRAPASSVLR